MGLPSKVVSLWFWPRLEQALVPSCIQCMDNGLVSHNFPAVLSAYTKMLQYYCKHSFPHLIEIHIYFQVSL